MKNNNCDYVKTAVSGSHDRTRGFALGLTVGTMIGAGVALWLSPALRQQLDDSARALGTHAADQYEQAGAKVAAVVDGLTNSAQDVRDVVADGVARGAHEVERLATAAKG